VGRSLLDRPSSRWDSAGTADGLRRRPVFLGCGDDKATGPQDLDFAPTHLELGGLVPRVAQDSGAAHVIHVGSCVIDEQDR